MSNQDENTDMAREKLLEALREMGIQYEKILHPPVMTVDAQMEHVGDLVENGAVVAKNLFLKDKRGKYMLITARHDTEVDLKAISSRLGLGKSGLRMAPSEQLTAVLNVQPGCATPLAFHTLGSRESDDAVILLIDSRFKECKNILVHPLTNDQSIALRPDDLEKFLKSLSNQSGDWFDFVDLNETVSGPPDLMRLRGGVSSREEMKKEKQHLKGDVGNKNKEEAIGNIRPSHNIKPQFDSVEEMVDRLLSIIEKKSTAPLALRSEIASAVTIFKNASYTSGFCAGRACK